MFYPFSRPPHEDLEPKVAAGLMRWVSNNDDVVREKQKAHVKLVSSQVRCRLGVDLYGCALV